MTTEEPHGKKTFTDQIELLGNELVDRVKEIVAEGNVRQLRIKASDGDIYLETPLTIGVLAGSVVTLAAPWLAILGVIAALVTHVQLEVVREVDDPEADQPKDDSTSTPA